MQQCWVYFEAPGGDALTDIDSRCCVLSDKDLTASHLSRSNSGLNIGTYPAKANFSLVERHLQALVTKDAFLSASDSEKVGVWKPSVRLPLCVYLLTCYPYDYTIFLQIRTEECHIHSSDCKGMDSETLSACLHSLPIRLSPTRVSGLASYLRRWVQALSFRTQHWRWKVRISARAPVVLNDVFA